MLRQPRANLYGHTDFENTHSDTAGPASMSGFHGTHLHSYVNMELAQPPLDHFYPHPIPQQFKNPLALAPLKTRKGGKAKSKTGLR